MQLRELDVTQHERELGLDVNSDLKVSSQCQQAYSKTNRIYLFIKDITKYRNSVNKQKHKANVQRQLECAYKINHGLKLIIRK